VWVLVGWMLKDEGEKEVKYVINEGNIMGPLLLGLTKEGWVSTFLKSI